MLRMLSVPPGFPRGGGKLHPRAGALPIPFPNPDHRTTPQEVVTQVVFIAFAFCYFRQKPQWNHVAAFLTHPGAVAYTLLPGR